MTEIKQGGPEKMQIKVEIQEILERFAQAIGVSLAMVELKNGTPKLKKS